MPPFNKRQFPFVVRGVQLNAPPDYLTPGYVPFALNYRRETDGSITPRAGQGTGREVVAGQSPVHSMRRLNDSSDGVSDSTIIVGTGTHVATCAVDLASSASVESGFSGNPLSICIHRPSGSTQPWAYIGDGTQLRKISQAGVSKAIGIPTPDSYPSAVVLQPQYKVLDELNDHTLWTAAGTAGSKANYTRVDSATRSVTAILYDSGTTGWACVRPSSMADIGEGMRLTINAGGGSAETVTVEQVFKGSAATNIAGIIYESGGGNGVCSIHLETPLDVLEVGSLVLIASSEYARVLSVHVTPDGFTSFRCSVAGTYAAAASVQAFASFRAYFAGNHAAAESLSAAAVEFQVTAGKGYISRTVAVDLSLIATGVPTRPEDDMHIDLYVDKPDLVSEIKLYLDINNGTANFEENVLVHTFRSNDLTPLTKDEQTLIAAQQTREQRAYLEHRAEFTGEEGGALLRLRAIEERNDAAIHDNDPLTVPVEEDGAIRDRQLDAGQNQWTSARFKISQLLTADVGRIGADLSRGLKDVAALRIAIIATGTVLARVDGWWIGGGYGPDVSVSGRNRIYRYRALDSSTGAVSNWSAAMFGGVRPRRQKVLVSLPQHYSALYADKLQVQVLGGDLLNWHYAGTVANGLTPTYEDTLSDEDLAPRRALSEQENTHYRLWPQQRPPDSGSSATIVGNLVVLNSGSVDPALANGNAFRCGGKDFTVHRLIDSTRFYTTESGGLITAQPWEVPEPLIEGKPLPILAGPFFNFYFGMGDLFNPWRLYYTNGNDPDTTRDTHWIDVEGEILQNMVILEGAGRAILFTTERAFMVEPAFSTATTGGGLFVTREIPDSAGLFARWACCEAGGEAVYLSKDGIYATSGGGTRLISADLRPLFPRGASQGVTTNGIAPPNMTLANQARFRLSYADRELYFDYVDTDGNQRTLVNERGPDNDWIGWMPYSYAIGARVHYGEEGHNVHGTLLGGSDGKLYRLARAQADAAGAAISARVLTPDFAGDDLFAQKWFGDSRLDADRDGATLTVTPGINHRATLLTAKVISAGAGRAQTTIDLSAASGGVRAKDLSLEVSTSITTERPKLFAWRFTDSELPDDSLLRAETYELREPGLKWARGVWIYAYTAGLDRDVTFEYTGHDGAVATIVISAVNHAELTERFYPFAAPVYLSASRVRPTDTDPWQFVSHRIEGEPAPPYSTEFSAWRVYEQTQHVRGLWIDADTLGAAVTVTVQYAEDDGTNGTFTIAVTHDRRERVYYPLETPVYLNTLRLRGGAAILLWGFDPMGEPAPPKSSGPTAWLIEGIGARLVQGVVFDIDTAGASVDMAAVVDMGATQTTINAAANKGPVVASGRAQLPFSFDAPFITHLLRFNPSAACRIFGIKVIDEPEPELAYMWHAQQTDMGSDAFKYLGDGSVTVRSTSAFVLELIADGTTYTPTFYDASNNSAGERRTYRFRCPPVKFKSVRPRLYAATAAGRIALYKKEFHIEYKPWSHEGLWLTANLMGDAHYANGARI